MKDILSKPYLLSIICLLYTSEESIQHHANASIEDEPNQVLPRVASGKFLRFVVISKGIHLDPMKVRAIQEMQPPRNLRELRGL